MDAVAGDAAAARRAGDRAAQLTEEEAQEAAGGRDKQIAELSEPQPAPMVDFSLFFEDWREVDGVKFPHKMRRASEGTTNEEWTVNKVKVNPKIDAKKFAVETAERRGVHVIRKLISSSCADRWLARRRAVHRPLGPAARRLRRLRIVVKDPSGAVIPGALVQVKGAEDRTAAVTRTDIASDGQGVATVDRADARALRARGQLSRVRDADHPGRPRPRRRQPARRDAGDPEARRDRVGRPRQGDGRLRSEQRSVQHRAVEGPDRRAAGRSRTKWSGC